ncbi:hypothetical protein T484DRAFT_1961093 [Baffinella frigidus]|nr:hypothetical protein T484DRAFT_1961093 [Cryptophyta sp. CCMP2293]
MPTATTSDAPATLLAAEGVGDHLRDRRRGSAADAQSAAGKLTRGRKWTRSWELSLQWSKVDAQLRVVPSVASGSYLTPSRS